jgi:HEAT repeat protein
MLLDDPETEVQLAALEALGEIGGEEAERILARRQREAPTADIRQAASDALAQSQLLSVPIRDDAMAEPDFSDGGFDGPGI